MLSEPGLVPLGRMAVFYVPAAKLAAHPDVAIALDEFLLHNYEGFTKISQHVEGRYKVGPTVVKDDHVRYEVSFLGKDRIPAFIAFVRQLCSNLGEESIYITMGQHAYLVRP